MVKVAADAVERLSSPSRAKQELHNPERQQEVSGASKSPSLPLKTKVNTPPPPKKRYASPPRPEDSESVRQLRSSRTSPQRQGRDPPAAKREPDDGMRVLRLKELHMGSGPATVVKTPTKEQTSTSTVGIRSQAAASRERRGQTSTDERIRKKPTPENPHISLRDLLAEEEVVVDGKKEADKVDVEPNQEATVHLGVATTVSDISDDEDSTRDGRNEAAAANVEEKAKYEEGEADLKKTEHETKLKKPTPETPLDISDKEDAAAEGNAPKEDSAALKCNWAALTEEAYAAAIEMHKKIEAGFEEVRREQRQASTKDCTESSCTQAKNGAEEVDKEAKDNEGEAELKKKQNEDDTRIATLMGILSMKPTPENPLLTSLRNLLTEEAGGDSQLASATNTVDVESNQNDSTASVGKEDRNEVSTKLHSSSQVERSVEVPTPSTSAEREQAEQTAMFDVDCANICCWFMEGEVTATEEEVEQKATEKDLKPEEKEEDEAMSEKDGDSTATPEEKEKEVVRDFLRGCSSRCTVSDSSKVKCHGIASQRKHEVSRNDRQW